MAEYNLRYPGASDASGGYRLIELPHDLCKLIEGDERALTRLEIKGHPTDDAVLCTEDKTYSLRSVVLSNSVLVVTPPAYGGEDDVVIRDTLNEILELVPVVPKLHKLKGLLRGQEYDGDLDEEEDNASRRGRRISYAEVQDQIQASDNELARGIRNAHILTIKGNLRPITRAHLLTVLELLLNTLVSMSMSHGNASVEDLSATLQEEHDVPRTVCEQVMSWFGELDKPRGIWKMDVDAMVQQVGIGILSSHKDEPIAEREFLAKWKTAVGDAFESSVALPLLLGNYLSAQSMDETVLSYFPASDLPVEPAARFGDLFLTRHRWKAADITPFLSDIAVDSKERDKFLLKYARAITDSEGIWYTARAQYTG